MTIKKFPHFRPPGERRVCAASVETREVISYVEDCKGQKLQQELRRPTIAALIAGN